jgi:hypothetical protein
MNISYINDFVDVKNDIFEKGIYLKCFANTLLKVGTNIYRWQNEIILIHVAQAKRIFYDMFKSYIIIDLKMINYHYHKIIIVKV